MDPGGTRTYVTGPTSFEPEAVVSGMAVTKSS